MRERPPVPRVALRPAEAAQAIGVSKRYLAELIAEEELSVCCRGRVTWILISDLEAFIRGFRVTAPGEGDS